MALVWLGKELRALRNFSVGHFNNRGGFGSDSPLAQALTELDGALTDLGTVHEDPGDEILKPLLTRDEARKGLETARHEGHRLKTPDGEA